jgi:2-polyprenyl-3-methyl-5-hydroxy-6-metoxy-1,4-benzoquinol methylase
MVTDQLKSYNVPTEKYHQQHRPEMLNYVPKDIKVVLDVGCGEGGFGELFKKERNGEVWGIELVSQAAEKAKSKLDRVFTGNFETDTFDLPEEYFDCIVFNDVLEHLYDPWEVLKQTRKLLKSGGYVLASIPNVRYYEHVKRLAMRGDWEYTAAGLMDRTHLRFFTCKSAKTMLKQSGYKITQVEGIGFRWNSWKFNLLNQLFGRRLEDMRYVQFAYLAQKTIQQ